MHEEVGVDDRRGAQNVSVTLDLSPQRELLALRGVSLAEQIGAKSHLDARSERLVDRADTGVQHIPKLAKARLGDSVAFSELRDLVVGDQSWDKIAAAFRHEARRGVVNEIAMFNGAHTRAYGALDGLRDKAWANA